MEPIRHREDLHIAVNDGWKCFVSHYYDDQEHVSLKKQPVVLCHGIATHGKCFDLSDDVSLVDYLLAQGYHIYNLNLRGVGGSFCRSSPSDTHDFNFDDLLSDVHPIIKFIINHHTQYSPKNKKVHWIGHSMGALLMYGFLSQKKSNKNLVESFVALGGPAELKYIGQPVLLELLRFRSLLKFHLKIRKFSRHLSFLMSLFNTKYHNLVLNKYAVHQKMVRGFLREGVGDISLPLLEQLSDWITSGEMRSRDGKVDYGDMGKNVQIPTLLMSGGYDSFSPPHALLKTYSDIPLPSRKKKMVILSKISGFSFDYCHAGIIAGKKAREEVFPILSAWLDRFSKV